MSSTLDSIIDDTLLSIEQQMFDLSEEDLEDALLDAELDELEQVINEQSKTIKFIQLQQDANKVAISQLMRNSDEKLLQVSSMEATIDQMKKTIRILGGESADSRRRRSPCSIQ